MKRLFASLTAISLLLMAGACNRISLLTSRTESAVAADPIFLALAQSLPADPTNVAMAASTSLAAAGVILCVDAESKDCNGGLGHYYSSDEKVTLQGNRFFLMNVRVPLQDKLRLTAVSIDANGTLLGSKTVEIRQK